MRSHPIAVLAATIATTLTSASPLAQQAAPAPARTGAISGVAIDAVTGQPVPGATVSLGDLDDRANRAPRMTTDARGRFVFHQLPPSAGYFLDARGPGYAHTRYGWTRPGQSLTINDISRIDVAEDRWVSGIEIPLWRLGVIEGRVIDERGEPVVGVAVRVFSTRTIAGRRQLVGGPVVTTDDRGAYRVTGLDPGEYVLGVPSVQSTVLDTTTEAPMERAIGELATGGIGGGRGASVYGPTIDAGGRHRLALTNFATPPPPSGSGARAYPPTFHPAAVNPADATPLAIDYGTVHSSIDLQLYPAPVVRVAGRVEPPPGVAPPRFLLRLMPEGSERLGFGSEAATTVVEPDGAFTFLNVPSGRYTLLAQASVMDFTSGSASIRFADAPGFPAGGIAVGSTDGAPGLGYLLRSGQPAPVWGRASVSVGTADVADLVVPLRPTVSARGTIVFAEGSETATRALVRAEPADGDPTLAVGSARASVENGVLAFELQGLLTGRYLLDADGGLVSVTHRGRDVTYTGIDVTSGVDIDDVVVTVDSRRPDISGVVHGRPDDRAVAVISFPVDRTRWTNYGWRGIGFRTTRSGSEGAYRLAGVQAGEHYVVAVPADQIDAWVDPAFLEAAVPHAVRVTVDWGRSATQDVPFAVVSVR